MNKNYYVMGAFEMLNQLNETTEKRGWHITASTDGDTFSLFATKDEKDATEMPVTSPIGDSCMKPEQFLCTLAILLNAEIGDSSKNMVQADVLEDYLNTVMRNLPARAILKVTVEENKQTENQVYGFNE